MKLIILENISNGLASGSEVDWGQNVIQELEAQIGKPRWEWSIPIGHINRQVARWTPPQPREVIALPDGESLAEQIHRALCAADFSGKENETHRRRLTSIAEAIEEKAKLQAEEKAHKESLSLVDPEVSDLEIQSARANQIDRLSRVRISKALTEVLSAALEIETESEAAQRWTPLAHALPEPPQVPDVDFDEEDGPLDSAIPLRSAAEIHDIDQPRGVDEIRTELHQLVQQLDEEALYFIGCPPRSRQGLDYILRERLQTFHRFEAVGTEFLQAIGTSREQIDARFVPSHPAFQRLFSWRLAQLDQPVESLVEV